MKLLLNKIINLLSQIYMVKKSIHIEVPKKRTTKNLIIYKTKLNIKSKINHNLVHLENQLYLADTSQKQIKLLIKYLYLNYLKNEMKD